MENNPSPSNNPPPWQKYRLDILGWSPENVPANLPNELRRWLLGEDPRSLYEKRHLFDAVKALGLLAKFPKIQAQCPDIVPALDICDMPPLERPVLPAGMEIDFQIERTAATFGHAAAMVAAAPFKFRCLHLALRLRNNDDMNAITGCLDEADKKISHQELSLAVSVGDGHNEVACMGKLLTSLMNRPPKLRRLSLAMYQHALFDIPAVEAVFDRILPQLRRLRLLIDPKDIVKLIPTLVAKGSAIESLSLNGNRDCLANDATDTWSATWVTQVGPLLALPRLKKVWIEEAITHTMARISVPEVLHLLYRSTTIDTFVCDGAPQESVPRALIQAIMRRNDPNWRDVDLWKAAEKLSRMLLLRKAPGAWDVDQRLTRCIAALAENDRKTTHTIMTSVSSQTLAAIKKAWLGSQLWNELVVHLKLDDLVTHTIGALLSPKRLSDLKLNLESLRAHLAAALLPTEHRSLFKELEDSLCSVVRLADEPPAKPSTHDTHPSNALVLARAWIGSVEPIELEGRHFDNRLAFLFGGLRDMNIELLQGIHDYLLTQGASKEAVTALVNTYSDQARTNLIVPKLQQLYCEVMNIDESSLHAPA